MAIKAVEETNLLQKLFYSFLLIGLFYCSSLVSAKAQSLLSTQNVAIDENGDGIVTLRFEPNSAYMPSRHGQILSDSDLSVFGLGASPAFLVQECGLNLNYPSQCLAPFPDKDRQAGYIKGGFLTLSFSTPAHGLSLQVQPLSDAETSRVTLTLYDRQENILGEQKIIIENPAYEQAQLKRALEKEKAALQTALKRTPVDKIEVEKLRSAVNQQETRYQSALARYQSDILEQPQIFWRGLSAVSTNDQANDLAFATLEAEEANGLLVDSVRIERLLGLGGAVPVAMDRRPAFSGLIAEAAKERIATGAEGPVIAERNIRPTVRPLKPGFRAAEVDRLAIDWPAARRMSARLREAGFTGDNIITKRDRDLVRLPILVPRGLSSDPMILAKPDFYYATLSGDGWFLNIHGTRLSYRRGEAFARRLPRQDRPPGEAIRFFDTETGKAASFSLFGAQYAVSLTCDFVETQSLCADESFLREHIDDLILALGKPSEGGE